MAAAFDAAGGTANNISNAGASKTVSHTVGGSGTAVFGIVMQWGNVAGDHYTNSATYNAVAMTKIGVTGLSNANDQVIVYGLAGPATGANNMVVNCSSGAANAGAFQTVSFSGTDTSGTVWADFTSTKTAANAANSTITIPNGTSSDCLIDGVAIGADITPGMTAHTNRSAIVASNHLNGEGEGASYESPWSTDGVMAWTFSSTSSAQAGCRVLNATSAVVMPTHPVFVNQARQRTATR